MLQESSIYQTNADLNEDLLQKLIVGICTESDTIARKLYNTGVRDESLFIKIKSIFDKLFDIQLDDSRFVSKEMMAVRDAKQPYSFNSMSDGERAAFFYIATVLAAPDNSYIVVDEPENHLNPAIYNKIWDLLIDYRKDCQFIFISHTLDFIIARTNFELVRIKEFIFPDKFKFDFLGNSIDSLEMSYIVEIMGSRKPIIFCEGQKNSFDYKIYELLLGNEYTIIPVGNCSRVIQCVEATNMHVVACNTQRAIGIIDSDLKNEEEVANLKKKKIYVLKCNEIEMLLLDEMIFRKVLIRIYKEETTFCDFKKSILKKFKERQDYIIKRMVKTQIDAMLQHAIIDDKCNKTKDELKNSLGEIIKHIDVDEIWDKTEKKVEGLIATDNYDGLIKYCCLEHHEIIPGITNKYVNDYPCIALGILRDDGELKYHIKNKYLNEIENLLE